MELVGVTHSLSGEIYLGHQTFIHSNHTKRPSTSHEMGQIGAFPPDFGRSVDGMENSPANTFGKRYGEVLLVSQTPTGPQVAVFNTFPLNDCPQDAWSALNPQALASENGVAAALLNGPRYWLMSEIVKTHEDVGEKKTFGGIEMLQQATVELSSMNPAPYSVNKVNRRTVFVFGAGRPVFELRDPQGQRWVMQSWSRTVDPALSLEDLPSLGARLQLPDGWSYRTTTLTSPLRIDTTIEDAHVTQDNLGNTYSLAVA
jgi:hypothetical protein